MTELDTGDKDLVEEIEILLSASLGVWPGELAVRVRRLPGMAREGSATFHGVRTTFLYALITCGGAFLVSKGNPEPHLLSLSIWGAFYLGWAVFCSRRATGKVLAFIREDVLRLLSTRTKQSILRQLRQRFGLRRVSWTGWTVALVALVAATMALGRDIHGKPGLSTSPHLELQLVFWGLGWLAIFLTAARCTDVARFYSVFAEHLRNEEGQLYPLDPSASALVIGIESIGRTIFSFWVGISLAILTLTPILVTVFPWSEASYFRWLILPISLSFSLLFATSVFLKSESTIRRSIQRVVRRTLSAIEQEVARLLARGPDIEEAERARLKELIERHESIVRLGAYKSLFLRGLSVLPLLSSVILILGGLHELTKK